MFNIAITQEIEKGSGNWSGQARWKGTFGDDQINFNDLDTSSINTSNGEKVPTSDFMDGKAGNDVLIAGSGGDKLVEELVMIY